MVGVIHSCALDVSAVYHHLMRALFLRFGPWAWTNVSNRLGGMT
jgi:hypothetical protein